MKTQYIKNMQNNSQQNNFERQALILTLTQSLLAGNTHLFASTCVQFCQTQDVAPQPEEWKSALATLNKPVTEQILNRCSRNWTNTFFKANEMSDNGFFSFP